MKDVQLFKLFRAHANGNTESESVEKQKVLVNVIKPIVFLLYCKNIIIQYKF